MGESPTEIGDVIDDIPVGRFHRTLLVATGAVWASTAFGVLSISFVLPTLIQAWNLSGTAAGLLGSATLVGMIFGTPLGGRYADAVGRTTALAWIVTGFSVFTALTALATGLYSALIFRFLTGLAVGGTISVASSYLTEHLPTRSRGRYVAYLEVFYALGNIVTVAVAWVVLSVLPAGGTVAGIAVWRLFFAVGLAPIVFVPVIYWRFSESPYFLAREDSQAAGDRLAAIAREADIAPDRIDDAVRAGRETETSFARLFDPDLRRTTLLLSVAWFGLNFGYYGVFIWLPDTVAASGYVGNIYAYLFAVGVFQLFGVLGAAAIIDSVGRRLTLGGSLTLSGVFTFLFASALPGVGLDLGLSGRLPFLFGMLAMGFFLFGAFAVMFPYTSESFPTEVRGTGIGFTAGMGKFAAVASPVVVGALAGYGHLVALAPTALALLVAGTVLLLFGEETKDRTLI